MMGVADRAERQHRRQLPARPSTATTASATSMINLCAADRPRAQPRRARPRTRPAAGRPGRRTCAPRRLHRRRSTSRQTRSDGKPMYKVTSEEDVNVFDGDGYLPQENYPPATATVATDPRGRRRPAAEPDAAAVAAGRHHLALRRTRCTRCDVTNQAFLDGGGSPFEGQDRPLVRRQAGHRAHAARRRRRTSTSSPTVPIPTHFWGLTINDLGPDARQAQRQLRRGAGPAVRADGPLRLVRPAGRHRAHRLQRPVRGARAVDRHVQLPGAGRSLPEHVPLRRATTPVSRGARTRTTTRGSAPSRRTSRPGRACTR